MALLYAGVWKPTQGTSWDRWGMTYADFISKNATHNAQGLYLVDFETYVVDGIRRWAGLWRPGSNQATDHFGLTIEQFLSKNNEYRNRGLFLTDIETYVENGAQVWAGLWRPASGTGADHFGMTYQEFLNKWNEYRNRQQPQSRLLLADFEVYHQGGRELWAGLWRSESTRYNECFNYSEEEFLKLNEKNREDGLYLSAIRTHVGPDRSRRWSGLWRPSVAREHINMTESDFRNRIQEYRGQRMRLVDLEAYTSSIPNPQVDFGGKTTVSISRQRLQDREGVSRPREEPAANVIVCTYQSKDVLKSFDDSFLLSPIEDVTWPGATVDSASWATGSYIPITAGRKPLTIYIQQQNYRSPEVIVQDPKPSTVQTAINDLINRATVGAFANAGVYEDIIDVYSATSLRSDLKLSYDSGIWSVDGMFSYDDSSILSRKMYYYIQQYYTIAINPPATPGDFFISQRQIRSEDAYISTVKYGRMLLFSIESSEDKITLEGALSAAGFGAKVDWSGNYETVLRNSRIKVFARGGPTEGIHRITDGAEGIRNWKQMGETPGPGVRGVPIAYTMRFLSDNAQAWTALSTQFIQRQCYRTQGIFTIKINRIYCEYIEDNYGWDGEGEFYGMIRVKAFESGKSKLDEYPWSAGEYGTYQLRGGRSYGINYARNVIFDDIRNHECVFQIHADIWEDDSSDDQSVGGYRIVSHDIHRLPMGEQGISLEDRDGDMKIIVYYEIVPVPI